MGSRWPNKKKIKTNYEAQFPINPMLKDEIEKKKIQLKKDQKTNNLSQPRLTRQTHNLVHVTGITSYKVNQNKLWSSIPKQFDIKGWNEKKSIKKRHKKQHELTH